MMCTLLRKKVYFICCLFFCIHRTESGAEYLFQPKEDDGPDLQTWISSISAIIEEGASAGPSKSQTLPAASTERKDEPKRRSFFTLKKR